MRVTIEFARPVADAIDERTGRRLGRGKEFKFEWRTVEAVFLSFRGPLPRP
jgi:hypothetical protein